MSVGSRCIRGLAALLLCATASAAQESRARLEFDPPSAEVGEVVRATLVLAHPAGARPAEPKLALDDSWLILDTTAGGTTSDPAQPTLARSLWRFEVVSLEPGERSIPDLTLSLGEELVKVECAPLLVRSVLREDEDAPRALKGLLELATTDKAALPWIWIGALVALAAALATWLAFRLRARSRAAPQVAPVPSLRLAVLEARPLDTAEDVQAAHFALTRLLREAADLRAGRDRSGLTDGEWRDAAESEFHAAGLSGEDRAARVALLSRSEQVKYGSERPTHWATREALASARLFAVRLEPGLGRKEVAA